MVNEYANPRKHIGPFKAYLVTVYTTGFNVAIDMLVLGCASSRSAILTALRDCSDETRALGIKQVIPYDNLIDRNE